MKKEQVIKDIENVEFITGENFSYNFDREFNILSSYLSPLQKQYLETDFNSFFKRGKYTVFNTFCGGILFLKVPELIEKIKINSRSNRKDIEVSVVFSSEIRRPENIKYKPNAGKIETVQWNTEYIFPHFYHYSEQIQKALLLMIVKVVKRICEYGRTHFVYMNIENEFDIELWVDDQIILKKCVEKD